MNFQGIEFTSTIDTVIDLLGLSSVYSSFISSLSGREITVRARKIPFYFENKN